MNFLKKISGDKQLWVYTTLLMLFSFWIIYSASSNLSNVYGKFSPSFYVFKHFIHISVGFFIMFIIHKKNPNFSSRLSIIAIPILSVILLYTLLKGSNINSASRWLQVPLVGSVQPSAIAFLFLMMFSARFFGKKNVNRMSFSEAFKSFWIWVYIIVGLVLPTNLSTASLMFLMVLLVAFLASYPFIEMLKVLGIGFIGFVFLILVIKAFPNQLSHRLDTWQGRIERYLNSTKDGEEEIKINYQVTHAKIAIAQGGVFGFRPGKSVQKNFLPQSVSDFIFAIIIEEYSLTGGIIILFLYFLLALRFFFIAKKAKTTYCKLLVLSVGLPIIFQAFVNMSVAVNLIPVTGQPLPFLSSGGTAIGVNSFAIGIILGVSRYTEEEEKKDLKDYVVA